MATLTSPQAICSCTSGVSTINLSCGERPVYFPVFTTNAPWSVNNPSLRFKAYSTNLAGHRL